MLTCTAQGYSAHSNAVNQRSAELPHVWSSASGLCHAASQRGGSPAAAACVRALPLCMADTIPPCAYSPCFVNPLTR